MCTKCSGRHKDNKHDEIQALAAEQAKAANAAVPTKRISMSNLDRSIAYFNLSETQCERIAEYASLSELYHTLWERSNYRNEPAGRFYTLYKKYSQRHDTASMLYQKYIILADAYARIAHLLGED